MSIIKDPETYERYRAGRAGAWLPPGRRARLWRDHHRRAAAATSCSASCVRDKLIYYPTVTREPFHNRGRITDLIESGKLFDDLGLPPLNRGE